MTLKRLLLTLIASNDTNNTLACLPRCFFAGIIGSRCHT
jgi:hypothetical protein